MVWILSFIFAITSCNYFYGSLEEMQLQNEELKNTLDLNSQDYFETSVKNYFINLPTIETTHLILRPLNIEDASALYPILFDTQEEDETKRKKAAEWIEYKQMKQKEGEAIPWAIILKETEDAQLIGFIGLDWLNLTDRRCRITRAVSKNYKEQEKGLVEEALKMMLKVGFEDLHFHKINLEILEGVKAKQRLEKMGFVFEGVLSKHCRQIDESGNEIYLGLRIYRMLSEEYFEKQKENVSVSELSFGDRFGNWFRSLFLNRNRQPQSLSESSASKQ